MGSVCNGVVVFHTSMLNMEKGCRVCLHWCSGSSRDLWLIGGGGSGMSALVSVHSAICET